MPGGRILNNRIRIKVKEEIPSPTILRKQDDKICLSFIVEIQYAQVDGVSGGCLNAISGSLFSQYSSSHSVGKSTSMLIASSVTTPQDN